MFHEFQLSTFSSRESYPVLISCLEEVQNLYSDGTSDQKKKCETAKDILNSIYNTKFALSLAVLCDVYTIYSNMALLLQVNFTFVIEKFYFLFISLAESVHTSPCEV